MTVRELYEWAEKNNCLDVELFKNSNLSWYPIDNMYYIEDAMISNAFGEDAIVVVD